MSWIKERIAKECNQSPEFKAAYEEESALLALVRERNSVSLSQKDVEEALHVSHPNIAQVERDTKPIGPSLMIRHAIAVGASIEVKPGKQGKQQEASAK